MHGVLQSGPHHQAANIKHTVRQPVLQLQSAEALGQLQILQ